MRENRRVTRLSRLLDRLWPARLRTRLTWALAWDLFMVWVALVNLGLIAFDLTYLWLRPSYLELLPTVPRLYDPVKGIEPHPLTEALLAEARALSAWVEREPERPAPEERLEALRTLTARVLLDNPFERSGQSKKFEALRRRLAAEVEVPTLELAEPVRAAAAAAEFWPAERDLLRHRLELFEGEMAPLLASNYFREFDRGGDLVDHFFWIDLPFLALFWIEFFARWRLAVRRRSFARPWFYPIFHWYDVLGLLPAAYFRPFRILRVVSIYMRLRRSELSTVGKDVASRAVAYFSNIVAEEVSDRVALRILSEFEDEIRDGTHRRIVARVVGGRRAAIERLLAEQLLTLLRDRQLLGEARRLTELNLEHAVDRSRALAGVPLPDAVVRPLARSVGEVVVAATFESLESTLASPQGERAVARLAGAAVDRFFAAESVATVEPLAREIALEVLAEMKATVAVRKWALEGNDRGSAPPASGGTG